MFSVGREKNPTDIQSGTCLDDGLHFLGLRTETFGLQDCELHTL